MTPDKCWWTAAEIGAAGLPDMPKSQKGVELVAKRLNWRGSSLARRRAGRGGGWEYSWQLFPMSAQKKLLAESAQVRAVAPAVETMAELANRDDAWSWFETLDQKAKDEAARRLNVIQMVEALMRSCTKFLAVAEVARMQGVAPRTVWNWFEAIEGVRPDDRLPYLAPRHSLAPRKAATADMSPEFFDYVKSDYLRPAGPTLSSVYRRAVRVATQSGWTFPPERTLRRRFEANVSKATIVLARKGIDALKAMYPPQTRDKTALHAMEAVNADFHRFDVFVRWPAEPGQNAPAIVRPQMVAFQDIHSGRILSWRIDQTPNTEAVRLAAGDMLETYGIPEHVLLDNGREFASKFLTGGAPTRYRFRVREDDLPGLFVSLGCEIHWATPYAGQSKPIERAFRDMCDAISKDPRFDGAYTGPGTDAKPEDYGSRAVELEDFLAVLGEGIEEHNTRLGRRSEVAFGRSFADVFDASYATAPIRKATDAQRRYWLMGAEGLRADSKTGVVRFQGNEYWSEWMSGIAGDRLIARFDPAALWDGLHIYSADNAYLGHAPCKLKSGFFDVTEARSHAKARRAWMNAEKAALAAHRKLSATELGTLLDRVEKAEPVVAEAKVVRPVFGRPTSTVPDAAPRPDVEALQAEIVADLSARRRPVEPSEGPRDRFRRALELERAIEGGIAATPDQLRWLDSYQHTPEYASERMLWEDFGDAVFQ